MGSALHVSVSGSGERLILVHGGVGPELTWERQGPLAERFELVIPHRRGYPPSPDAERQDFLVDAADLEAMLLERPAHLVGFSYGGLGLTVAATRRPEAVLSVTLIEVPLWFVALDDPEVAAFAQLADAFTSGSADTGQREAFLTLAGIPAEAGAHAERLAVAERLAIGLRSPGEARPDLDRLVAAGTPAMVLSGDHHPAIERVCDALAERLRARRERLPGAGHAVPRAPGFNELLAEFAESSGHNGMLH